MHANKDCDKAVCPLIMVVTHLGDFSGNNQGKTSKNRLILFTSVNRLGDISDLQM